MAATSIKTAEVQDYHGKCRDCGAPLANPETIITYWDSVSSDGMNGIRTSEKGISEIAVNAGLCESCLSKQLRKRLEQKSFEAKKQDTNAPGTGAVALCAIGIFVFSLALLLKLTRVDEFGNPMPFITTWFYIWASLDILCIIGLPIAVARRKKLCKNEVSSIGEDLSLSDKELLSKYSLMNGVPFMKIAWNDYVMKQFLRGHGGLAYASELKRCGSVEAVSKAFHVGKDVAANLLSAASQYGSPKH